MFRRSCACGGRTVYTDEIATMGGTVKLRYCQECLDKKRKRDKLLMEERAEARRFEQEENAKQRRYEYLKREVELAELERKAKELGIE